VSDSDSHGVGSDEDDPGSDESSSEDNESSPSLVVCLREHSTGEQKVTGAAAARGRSSRSRPISKSMQRFQRRRQGNRSQVVLPGIALAVAAADSHARLSLSPGVDLAVTAAGRVSKGDGYDPSRWALELPRMPPPAVVRKAFPPSSPSIPPPRLALSRRSVSVSSIRAGSRGLDAYRSAKLGRAAREKQHIAPASNRHSVCQTMRPDEFRPAVSASARWDRLAANDGMDRVVLDLPRIQGY